jgi:hypothetical protein
MTDSSSYGCAYGDYSCTTPIDAYGAEVTSEEENIAEETHWYTNTTVVHFMYWTWGAAQVWSFIFGFMLYTWYPWLIKTD